MNLLQFVLPLIYMTIVKCDVSRKREVIDSVSAPAHIPTRHTVTEYHNAVPIPVPHPVPVPVPRAVPVHVPVGVPVDHPRPVPIIVPHPVAHIIPRPIAVPIDRPFPYPYPQPIPVTVTQGVGIPVPQPYTIGVPAPVPVRVPHPVPFLSAQHYVHPIVAQQNVAYAQGIAGNTIVESHGQVITHPY